MQKAAGNFVSVAIGDDMLNFSLEENRKLADFFYKAAKNTGNFRENILELFSDIFGYKHVTFWLVDKEGRLSQPRYVNVSDNIMQAWKNKYYRFDPFETKNLPKCFRRQCVVELSDLVNTADYFNKNLYYKDVLRNYGYIHKMILRLHDNDKLIGGMSFLRTDSEKAFDESDKRLISYVGQYVSNLLIEQLKFNDVEAEKQALLEFANLSNDGVIMVNEYNQIHYINQKAKFAYDKLLKERYVSSIENLITIGRFLDTSQANIDFLSYYELGNYGIYMRVKRFVSEKFYVIVISPKEKYKINNTKNTANADNLSKREREVLKCVLKGMSNVEISQELFVSLSTVKAHLYSIFKKLDVPNRTSLIARYSNFTKE